MQDSDLKEITAGNRPTWKRRLGIGLVNVLAFIITIPACFMVFVMGAFASDSGTTTAMIISFSLIGFSGLYAIALIASIVFSQLRNSFKLAALPILLPALFYIWILSI